MIKKLPSMIFSKSLPINAASSYTSSTVKFVCCCCIGDEHIIFLMASVDDNDSYSSVCKFTREKPSVFCEVKSGECLIDDDEDRSNQMKFRFAKEISRRNTSCLKKSIYVFINTSFYYQHSIHVL